MILRSVLGMDLLECKENNERLYLLFIKNVPIIREKSRARWGPVLHSHCYPKGPLQLHPDALEHWTGILLSTELEVHDGLINNLISLIDQRKEIADLLWDRLYFYNRIKPITDPKILYGNLYTKSAPTSIDYGEPIMTVVLGNLGKAIIVEKTLEISSKIVNARLEEFIAKQQKIYVHDMDSRWGPVSQQHNLINIDIANLLKDVATSSIKPTGI